MCNGLLSADGALRSSCNWENMQRIIPQRQRYGLGKKNRIFSAARNHTTEVDIGLYSTESIFQLFSSENSTWKQWRRQNVRFGEGAEAQCYLIFSPVIFHSDLGAEPHF